MQKKPEEVDRTIAQREITQARAEKPGTLADQGRPEKHYNRNVFNGENLGNSATYLTARIARDRPDILEKMKSGYVNQLLSIR